MARWLNIWVWFHIWIFMVWNMVNGALVYRLSFDFWVSWIIWFEICYDCFNRGLIRRLYFAITILHGGKWFHHPRMRTLMPPLWSFIVVTPNDPVFWCFRPNPYHVLAPWLQSWGMNRMVARLCWCSTIPMLTLRNLGGSRSYKNLMVLTSTLLGNSHWPLMTVEPRSGMFNWKLTSNFSVLLRVYLSLGRDGPKTAR